MTADGFLTKPVDKTELRTRVKTLVEKSERIRRQIGQKNRPLPPIIIIIVAVIAATLSTILIVTNEPATAEVIVKKEIEYREVVKEVEVVKEIVKKEIEYRDVVREVVKEVTVEKLIAQREFSSKEELEKWLGQDDTDEYIFYWVDDKGVPRTSDQYDCDDYALQLQQRASEDGFLMSVSIVQKPAGPHMINLATIGNDVLYIEPQTDEVWFYSHLD